jgi:hypothetical protein
MIRPDLTPAELAAAAAEGERLANLAASRRIADPPQARPPENVTAKVRRQSVEAVNRPALVAIRHFETGGQVFVHGAEIIPSLLAKATVNQLLDQGILCEYPERRSLYRIFAAFSGCNETEQLDRQESRAYSLTK